MPAASPARTLTPIEGVLPLFDDPAPDAPPPLARAAPPPNTCREIEPDEGAPPPLARAAPPPNTCREIEPDEGAPAPLDPSRWVMTGWRAAERVTLTREQILALFNTTQGPCAGCGTAHHRYGEDGQPLCPACRIALTANTRP